MINHALSSLVKLAGDAPAAMRTNCAAGDLRVVEEFYPERRAANRSAARIVTASTGSSLIGVLFGCFPAHFIIGVP